MKILMVLESEFPPDIRVENEIIALTNAGHKVELACSTMSRKPAREEYRGAIIHRRTITSFIHKSSVGCLKFPFYFNFWRRFIRTLCNVEKYDVIHIHDLQLSKVGIEFKKAFGLKLVIDLHENWPELLNISPHTKTLPGRLLCSISQWKSFEKNFLKEADKVIVVVDEAKERLIKLGLDSDNIYVVSNTINLEDAGEKIYSGNKPDQKTILVYEGGITFHRGLHIVLTAIKSLKEKLTDFEFWIIGTGSYHNTLLKKVNMAGLGDIVKFYGKVSQKTVFELLGMSDFAIIPHLKSPHTDSTIPHKLFHYIYAGLPVISSACIPLERIINETGCGVTYNNDDPGDLSDIILQIIENKSKFISKYSDSKSWVTTKYNWSSDSRNLNALYKTLQ